VVEPAAKVIGGQKIRQCSEVLYGVAIPIRILRAAVRWAALSSASVRGTTGCGAMAAGAAEAERAPCENPTLGAASALPRLGKDGGLVNGASPFGGRVTDCPESPITAIARSLFYWPRVRMALAIPAVPLLLRAQLLLPLLLGPRRVLAGGRPGEANTPGGRCVGWALAIATPAIVSPTAQLFSAARRQA
jgi:hypothetical protein